MLEVGGPLALTWWLGAGFRDGTHAPCLAGLQPGQARGLLPEERGERAAGQAAETEAAERRRLPPGLPGARRPGPGPRGQGSPAPSQRPPALLLAPPWDPFPQGPDLAPAVRPHSPPPLPDRAEVFL